MCVRLTLVTTLLWWHIGDVIVAKDALLESDDMTFSGDDGSGSGEAMSAADCNDGNVFNCSPDNAQTQSRLRNSSVVSGVTIDDEFTSGDGVTSSGYISGGDNDADDVIYIEEPRIDGKDRDVVQPVVEVYSSAPDRKQFELVPTTTRHHLRIKSRTTGGQEFRDRTSSVDTSTIAATSVKVEPVQVKSIDDEEEGRRSSSPNYVALMVNVALLAGIVFVVAVFLAVLVSFVLHRRRQRHRDVIPTTPHDRPHGVPRPTTKQAPVHLLVDRQRLFVNVSKVADPKEWFV